MFEKIVTRAFFITLFSALAVVGAHAFDQMHEMQLAQAAAKGSAPLVVAHDTTAEAGRNP